MKAVASSANRDLAIDLLCGMSVDMNKAKALGRTAECAGRTYYFCSEDCRLKFINNPDQYLKKKGQHNTEPKPASVALSHMAG
jgi:Cu+-exporting ATPase